MILDELNVFCRDLDVSANGGVNTTDVIDWGTGGNPLGSIVGAGHHGDDIARCLSWFVWAASAVTGPITVEWETSDDPSFGTASVVATRMVASTAAGKGAFLVNGEALPRGLKRYQRLKVTSGSGEASGKLMAFVVDVMGA